MLGYIRKNGKVGIRNHILIIPTVFCVNNISLAISSIIRNTKYINHFAGCGQLKIDYENTVKVLIGNANNPNIGGVIIISLGCEQILPEVLADKIESKDVEIIRVQKGGGYLKSIEKGSNLARKMINKLLRGKKEKISIKDLTLGLKCGASDRTTREATNPLLGDLADKIIEKKGKVIIGEITELLPIKDILVKRFLGKKRVKLEEKINFYKSFATISDIESSLAQPSPGNISGGICDYKSKALSSLLKAGHNLFNDIISCGDFPEQSGLYLLDVGSDDIASMSGMTSCGSQIIVFSTGLGNVIGSPIAPVIKVTSNKNTNKKMKDLVDIYISGDEYTVDKHKSAERLFNKISKVIDGELTVSEIFGFNDFNIDKFFPVF